MKLSYNKYLLAPALAMSLVFGACSKNQLDKIDTNPNAPIDVSLNLLLPQVTMNAVYSLAGGYTAKGVSTYVEHTTSVRLNTINPADVNEQLWTQAYYGLNDLKVLIEKAEAASSYTYLGIAQVLYAYNLNQLTDLYGDIPLTEALKGSGVRTPKFDTQQAVYTYLQDLLDQAITNLNKPAISNPKAGDLIFAGNAALWVKTAYGLKARFINRLSKKDPQGSATQALAAVAKAFQSPNEGFIFKSYKDGTAYDNPWSGMQNSQELFAVGATLLGVMTEFAGLVTDDPRSDAWFSKVNGKVVGAPSGTSVFDQGHLLYSQPARATVLTATATQPMLTFDELKFIEAEANLRLGNRAAAHAAYKAAIQATMARQGVAASRSDAYLLNPAVLPAVNELTLKHIINQKYISFWMFQPIEAFNDYRRTGFPTMKNPNGTIKRIPYPNSEVSRNPNTPANINDVTMYTVPVWWAN